MIRALEQYEPKFQLCRSDQIIEFDTIDEANKFIEDEDCANFQVWKYHKKSCGSKAEMILVREERGC